MIQLSQVALWRSDGLIAAAEALRRTAIEYHEVHLDLQRLFTEEFLGQAMQAEERSRRALVDDADDLYRAHERASHELFAAADAVDVVAVKARNFLADMQRSHLEVSETTGETLKHPGINPLPGRRSTDAYMESVDAVGRLIMREACAVVESLEATYKALEELVTPAGGSNPKIIQHGVAAPLPHWNGEEVNDWWTALSPEEQEKIIRDHPDWIGNLAGIPVRVRSRANCRRINALEVYADQKIAELSAWMEMFRKSGGLRETQAAVNFVETELNYWRAKKEELGWVKKKFDGTPDGVHTLVGLDITDGDRLWIAVGIGDVDAADHVLVHSPGMNSTVSGAIVGTSASEWGSTTEDIGNVVENAQEQLWDKGDRKSSVAAVVSLMYDAPKTDEVLSPTDTPISNHWAARHGEQMVSLMESIQASHKGDPHMVLSGHSYGSLGASYAARNTELVDDAAFFGSPRLREHTAAGHNLLPGHMNVGAADGDRITYFSAITPGSRGNPASMPDFVRWSTHEWQAPDGRIYTESTGHSEYMEKGSTSTYNLGKILIGDGVAVESGKE